MSWGIDPSYAVQMASFLQGHLQKALEHKLVNGGNDAPHTPEAAAIFQLINKRDDSGSNE